MFIGIFCKMNCDTVFLGFCCKLVNVVIQMRQCMFFDLRSQISKLFPFRDLRGYFTTFNDSIIKIFIVLRLVNIILFDELAGVIFYVYFSHCL